ncbi:THO complex subunit 5A-like [Phragmites australis]|uniref:THO complex subunit 5A-like n=1 Tax=Phragmites australis TaxID=29695 RepID=UPI002D78A5DE|nr:THO complex subunit 5A-like [Phragmites australis]
MAALPAAKAMDVEAPARLPPTASATKSRSPHDLLAETRASIEKVAARMFAIKSDGAPKSELRELVTQMSLLLITLRQVNREVLMEEDRVKAETEAAKAPVDSTTLQLHNLLYEKNHYVKAIRACLDFQTKYPGIELVPEEEFQRAAPADIRDKTLAADAAHDLMLKRLNFELVQRKELCKLHEKLEQQRSSLLETIANKKKFLSSLPSHLKSLKKASLPVQQQLGMQHTKKLKQHHAAELLPTPLYVAYTQLLGQKEAFGENIEVEIMGSTKDAQTFAQQQAKKENGTLSNGDNNRLDDDLIDDDEDVQRRRSRSKKNVVKETNNPAVAYQLHPLKIIVHVYDTEDSGIKRRKLITLRFEYLVKLNVVCVAVEDSEGLDINILCNLFPDDTGLELPHQMAKIYAGEAPNFSDKDSRPYKWAQHLSGIDFLPEVPPTVGDDSNRALSSANLSSGLTLYRQQNRAQTILQRIRSRKVAQMALMWQLDYLTKLKWPQIEHDNTPWASRSPLCSLHSWSLTGSFPEPSTHSSLMVSGAASGVDSDIERRSVTHWEETESTREDGELPVVIPAENTPNGSPMLHSEVSPEVRSHSRGLSLISKSATPSKLSISHSFGRNEDDLDLLMYSDSELEDQPCTREETEKGSLTVDKSWEDYASREFTMLLSKTLKNGPKVMLEAKVNISVEYPLRPPLFRLRLLSEKSENLKWHNDLRAMEAEVNRHILRSVPLSREDYILTHQVMCLAMLFDMHFDEDYEKSKVTSVIDVGLCKPVSGTMLTRSVRGRDRRQTIYWRGADCSSSYL